MKIVESTKWINHAYNFISIGNCIKEKKQMRCSLFRYIYSKNYKTYELEGIIYIMYTSAPQSVLLKFRYKDYVDDIC